MINENLTAHMKKTFPGPDGDSINSFLSKGFGDSNNGQVAVASIFLYAKGAGKTVQDVLPVLEKHLEDDWSFIHPDIRGDADAPANYGPQNRRILATVYLELGIPLPNHQSA